MRGGQIQTPNSKALADLTSQVLSLVLKGDPHLTYAASPTAAGVDFSTSGLPPMHNLACRRRYEVLTWNYDNDRGPRN